jgi:hypothetical protein
MNPIERARLRMGLGPHIAPPLEDHGLGRHWDTAYYYAPCPACGEETKWRGELLHTGITLSRPIGACC